MAVKAIIIATEANGAERVVGNVQPLSKAKEALKNFTDEACSKVELFELRSPAKRRKISGSAPVEKPAPKKKK